jgi:hypothetical protein
MQERCRYTLERVAMAAGSPVNQRFYTLASNPKERVNINLIKGGNKNRKTTYNENEELNNNRPNQTRQRSYDTSQPKTN